jgi:hypothetical protein
MGLTGSPRDWPEERTVEVRPDRRTQPRSMAGTHGGPRAVEEVTRPLAAFSGLGGTEAIATRTDPGVSL